jgi:ATP-dependent exoDNAse (exonuclease V) beta subunit
MLDTPSTETVAPADQGVRSAFVAAIDRNVSLICPAGTGKTHSAVQRIVALAQSPNSEELLRALVVVTFTLKAAAELQERAAAALQEHRLPGPVRSAFNQAYFGTIHGFAVLLLQGYGHHIGVPGSFEVCNDAAVIWGEFLRSWTGQDDVWRSPRTSRVLRFIPLQQILALARKWDFARKLPAVVSMPSWSFAPVYSFELPKRKDTAANISRFQQELRAWESNFAASNEFAPLPIPEKGGKEFITTATQAMAGIRSWLHAEACWLAEVIALDFRRYRIAAGKLTFADQINLAAELARTPEAIREIRKRGFRIILDEAQDTDPDQFALLIEVVRPLEATGAWTEGVQPPAGGRLTMVGDMQQSIYRDRADLNTYKKVHDYITRSPAGDTLSFGVTFRCGRAIVAAVNSWFPSVLDGDRGQVPFVPLTPRPGATDGQVLRIPICSREGFDADPEADEALQLAQWIASTGLHGLRATKWGEVAILCPRKRWFSAIRKAIHEVGLRSQLLSNRSTLADSPGFAWMTALAVVMADPFDSFEIVGVLREVFGVSDHDLAFFARSEGARFQIAESTHGKGTVEAALQELATVRRRLTRLPIGEAARLLDVEILRHRIEELCPFDHTATVHLEFAISLAAGMRPGRDGLVEWAAKMREQLGVAIEEVSRDDGAITIVTNLKAKGLEWDAVLVPFLFREISDRSEEYPRLTGRRSDPAAAVFSKGDITEAQDEAELVIARQELARIAYVTLTRARHSMVLFDDAEIFAADGPVPDSLGGILRFNEVNAIGFGSLSQFAAGDGPLLEAETRIETPWHRTDVNLAKARETCGNYPVQVTPHRLASSFTLDEPEVRRALRSPKPQAASAPRDYGVWWHNLMRDMPWAKGSAAWGVHFRGNLSLCPFPDRAAADWGRFVSSDLSAALGAVGARVYTEVPFHAPLKDGSILEGVMDLIALTPAGDRWRLVDWKTAENETDPAAIVARYVEQLKAYNLALTGITGLPADISIYNTALGELRVDQ